MVLVVVDSMTDFGIFGGSFELVEFIHVEGLRHKVFFVHQIGVVFVEPFYPAIGVDEYEMLFGEDKVADNVLIVIKVPFEVIADDFRLGVSGVGKHIGAIADVEVIDFVPNKGFKFGSIAGDFHYLFNDHYFFQLLDVRMRALDLE